MALFLRDDDVRACVTMDAMIDSIESMQRHYGAGEAVNLTRRKIIADTGMLSVMGGGLFYQGLLGVKTYTVVKGQYSFQVSLYDAETGQLLLYTQANRLGQLRTGATTGVAVKHLSNPGSVRVGIVGTGGQAPTQLEAVAKMRDVAGVKAFSRTAERPRDLRPVYVRRHGHRGEGGQHQRRSGTGLRHHYLHRRHHGTRSRGRMGPVWSDGHRSRSDHLACQGS